MAQNYYDWTGVLNLKQVTGVIQALFGGADLDAAYPGNGQAYIAEMSEGSCLRWDEIHEALVELAESYELEVTEDARECIKACAVLLAEHFGHSSEKVIEVLDGQVFDEDRPELTVLFELAQLFDDGHEITSVETEGAYHCSKPRLHEFGGNGLFIGKHVVVQRSSSSAIADGSGLESALRKMISIVLCSSWCSRSKDGLRRSRMKLFGTPCEQGWPLRWLSHSVQAGVAEFGACQALGLVRA